MRRYIESKYIVCYGPLIAVGSLFLISQSWAFQASESVHTDHTSPKETVIRQVDESIQEDSKDIFKNEEALFSYVSKFGLNQTITHLNELAPLYGDCHQSAHKAGRFAYEIYSTGVFRSVLKECHSGGFHGAIEAFFREHGTANLSDNLKVICSSELNPFFSHQCLHGIGHGLMAWTDYELFKALKACDLLNTGQASCWTGVFMENIVGGLAGHAHGAQGGHPTKFLNDDPQYPCTIVDEKYKSSCYFFQTSRMMQLFGGDFSKIAPVCSQVPTLYQQVCFESMGRDVGGIHRGNPSEAIQSCSFAPAGLFRTSCLRGAAQDAFWDPTGQDNAINFCKLLMDKTEKDVCYNTIFSRAKEVLSSKADLKFFCSKAEVTYQGVCLGFAQ